jgi:polyisoprenoid-binding protein YceI
MISRFKLAAAVVATATTLSLASGASAAPLKLDPAKSTVSAIFKQLNVPVEAKFKKFTAQIDFDSAKPESGKAGVDIDIASFDLGEAEYNEEVKKKDWFNAAQFPKASFVSSAIKATPGTQPGTKYDVTGKLTIKGKSADVHFPLSVRKDGTAQVFDGSVVIKRLAFNVGEGEWKDTGMVADEVTIKFHFVAAP